MSRNKVNLVILANESPDDHQLWIKACEFYKEELDYRIVDLSKNNWLEEIQKEKFDHLLSKPAGLTSKFKDLYDERIYILERVLNYKVYPSAEENFIYENKRFLSFWLKANKIPHPKTDVFYVKDDAVAFLDTTKFPLVAKVNIGASGSGVEILQTKESALVYLQDTFSGKGARQRVGPNLQKGGLLKRGFYYVLHPSEIKKKLSIYKAVAGDKQRDFVIFQQFVPHAFEWRVVRIGESFFAHKKLMVDGKASGSLLKGYDDPPLSLFDFVKGITDKHQLYSQAVDVFESEAGYLVNEMQCIFGQSDNFQMKVKDVIGRYRFVDNQWLFESGDYNGNECFNLRVEWVIKNR